MIFEILIVISAVAIFIILAIRLPENKEDEIGETETSLTGFNLLEKVGGFIPKFKLPKIGLPKINLPKMNKPDPVEEKKTASLSQKSLTDLMLEAKQLLQTGDLRNAEQMYLRLAAKDPRNAKIYANLGTIYLQKESYGDARDAFLAALKLDDTVALRHYNLGLAYIGLKTEAKAKVSIKRAIQLDPSKDKYSQTLDKIK